MKCHLRRESMGKNELKLNDDVDDNKRDDKFLVICKVWCTT